jgi:hypothetical protein
VLGGVICNRCAYRTVDRESKDVVAAVVARDIERAVGGRHAGHVDVMEQHVVAPGHDASVVGEEPFIVIDFSSTGNSLSGHVGRCPCGVAFRVANDDQLGHLIEEIQQHASGSHDHEMTREQILEELTSA